MELLDESSSCLHWVLFLQLSDCSWCDGPGLRGVPVNFSQEVEVPDVRAGMLSWPDGKKIHGLRIEIKNDVFDNSETEDPGASLKRHKTEPEFRGGM